MRVDGRSNTQGRGRCLVHDGKVSKGLVIKKGALNIVAAKNQKRRLGQEPMRIKRYHLASGSDSQTLENEVMKLVAEGWQPFGQLQAVEPDNGSRDRLLQPMVQYEGEIRN